MMFLSLFLLGIYGCSGHSIATTMLDAGITNISVLDKNGQSQRSFPSTIRNGDKVKYRVRDTYDDAEIVEIDEEKAEVMLQVPAFSVNGDEFYREIRRDISELIPIDRLKAGYVELYIPPIGKGKAKLDIIFGDDDRNLRASAQITFKTYKTNIHASDEIFMLTLDGSGRWDKVQMVFETVNHLRRFQANLDMLKLICKDKKLSKDFSDNKLFIMTKKSTSWTTKKHDKRFIRALDSHEENYAWTGKNEMLYRINKSNKPNGTGRNVTVKRTDEHADTKKRRKHSKSDIDWYVDTYHANDAQFLGNERDNFNKAHAVRQAKLEQKLEEKREKLREECQAEMARIINGGRRRMLKNLKEL